MLQLYLIRQAAYLASHVSSRDTDKTYISNLCMMQPAGCGGKMEPESLCVWLVGLPDHHRQHATTSPKGGVASFLWHETPQE